MRLKKQRYNNENVGFAIVLPPPHLADRIYLLELLWFGLDYHLTDKMLPSLSAKILCRLLFYPLLPLATILSRESTVHRKEKLLSSPVSLS